MIGMLQIEDQIISLSSALGLGLVEMSISLFALWIYAHQKTRLLLYFSLAWTLLAVFFMTNGISFFIESVPVFQISYVVFLPGAAIFWFAFIDDTMHESIGLKKMCVAVATCAILATFAILETWTYDQGRAEFVISDDNMNWWFLQVSNVIYFMMLISYAYWTTVTFRKSPPALKKQSRVLFVLGLFMLIGAVVQFTGDTLFLLLQSIIIIVVTAFTVVIIRKEPRIAHLLPYTVYKLLITSANGPKYYVKNWAEVEGLDDDMLAGLMSAIRTMAKGTVGKAIDTGAISELRMDKAILLTEMHYAPLNIILLASKASTALKVALSDFGTAFTKKFYDRLYDVNGFAKEVDDMGTVFSPDVVEPLVDKSFRNVSSFIEKRGEIADPIADATSKDRRKLNV